MKAQLAYWKKQLSGPMPVLNFPRTAKGSNGISFSTRQKAIELNLNLFSTVKSLARQENCTPFMILIAALSLVLYDATGQTDIRIGTLVANRRADTELTVGHFVNTVILRIRVSPRMKFSHLLKHVREVMLEAYAHQELPFEQLARVLTSEGSMKRAALFQVLFMYQTVTGAPPPQSGLTFAPIPTYQFAMNGGTTITTFDFIFDIRDAATQFTGTLTYKSDILDDYVTEITQSFSEILGCTIARFE
jgi:hypothetical protein